jgi:hypothetical protein
VAWHREYIFTYEILFGNPGSISLRDCRWGFRKWASVQNANTRMSTRTRQMN